MSSASEIYDALARIECSDFEEFVVRYLRETDTDLRGLISTGKNSKNKPIPCPVDAMLYIAASPPRCVAVAITTEMRIYRIVHIEKVALHYSVTSSLAPFGSKA